MSNSKSAVISTDNVPRSPKHLQLSAHVQSPQTVESPPLGAATELSSSLSPTKKSFKPHESAERLFNVTMVKSSSGNVTGNARFTPRPKSEAHRKIRKPVPARLSQPEEVTRLRSLSEDPAFTAISSHVNSDQPVYQNQSCGLGSSTSSQGRERTDSIGTSWATESSEPTSWVRQSYDSSAGQLVSRTSRASSSWNSQEKETFEKHEAVIKNSYLGRTAEQEARMESTRRSLQLRTNLGAAAPPPPFHRLASSSGLDSPYLLGMEIALPSPDLQVRMETAPRRHTQPTLCHNSNSLYDHDSYQSVRELAEPDKATNNSVVSSDSPEQTNTGVNINTSYLSSLQSIGPPMQTLDSTADGINLDTAIYSPLLVAVANGESEKVRSLIYSGESILQLTPDPLQLAVANNDLATVKAILESVPSNSIPKFWESTVLHTAARTGHLDIARVLLEHGATVHYQGKEGKTPLHIAARNGAIHILNLLLDFDDQPNCFSIAANRSPLGDAAIGGHVGTLEILLERGTYAPADIDQALMYAAKYGSKYYDGIPF